LEPLDAGVRLVGLHVPTSLLRGWPADRLRGLVLP